MWAALPWLIRFCVDFGGVAVLKYEDDLHDGVDNPPGNILQKIRRLCHLGGHDLIDLAIVGCVIEIIRFSGLFPIPFAPEIDHKRVPFFPLLRPRLRGRKEGNAWDPAILNGRESIDPEEHKRTWGGILEQLKGAVDIVAFQDGHTDYFELETYSRINRELCESFGMESWTNCESFDRDMPIKFLPIHWEKMLYKLRAAERAGFTEAITFEFSHFMSPYSIYGGAHGLYDRYMEYLEKQQKA